VAFWSGEKLRREIPAQEIVDPFDPDLIDCSAYTLTLGPEYFISPDFSTPWSEIKRKRLRAEDDPGVDDTRANPGQQFVIPPGQFAYLLTEEVVKIPSSAMGFISLKFGVKGPGLVNVSGFHVDPGYWGRLIFSVYNAGPSEARLRRRQKVFLLWIADLDAPSEEVKDYREPKNVIISDRMVSKADRPVHSLQRLSDRIERLADQVELIKSVSKAIAVMAGIIVAIASLIVAVWALGPQATKEIVPRLFPAHASTTVGQGVGTAS
jgi:dCTP deaminase